MNKEEILDEINKTKEHLANMEKMLQECEYERWKPKKNETYYYITTYGDIAQDWNNADCIDDLKRYKAYNCFKTIGEAKQESEKILVRRMLEDIAKRLNKGEKINWNDNMQFKRHIFFDNSNQMIGQESNTYCKRQGTVYCLDKDFAKIACSEIGEERLKKYLRGE